MLTGGSSEVFISRNLSIGNSIADLFPNHGSLAGRYAALRPIHTAEIFAESSVLLVMPIDMPFLYYERLQELMESVQVRHIHYYLHEFYLPCVLNLDNTVAEKMEQKPRNNQRSVQNLLQRLCLCFGL